MEAVRRRWIFATLSVLAVGACLLWSPIKSSSDYLMQGTPLGAQQMSAKGWSPLLPLSTALPELPLWETGVRDPAVVSRMPHDDGDALALVYEIKGLRGDLSAARGERRTEILGQLTENYAAMTYFLSDVLAGRKEANSDRGQVRKNLVSMRGLLRSFAGQWAKSATNKSDKARGAFHAASTQYMQGSDLGVAANALRSVAKMPIDAYLKRRAEFIVAMHDVSYGGTASRKKARNQLVSLIRSMPLEGALAARLLVARYDAGLNRNGHVSTAAKKSYRSYLWGASTRVGALSASEKQAVLDYSIAVWRKAEGRSSWSKPPVSLAAFGSHNPTLTAVIERGALADWNAGRLTTAVRKYRSLSKEWTGSPRKADIDMRILDMERSRASRTKQIAVYEKALIEAHKIYVDPAVLGESGAAKAQHTATAIRGRHKSFVHAELAQASRIARNRKAAIRMGETYLSFTDDSAEIEQVKAKIAGLYAQSGEHKTAVDLYRELAETTTSGKSRQYLLAAVASQSVLANWPAQAPWGKMPAGDITAREDLLSLYQRLLADAKNVDWFLLSQTGMLNIALGRTETAFQTWGAALAKSSRGQVASLAAGYMLHAYHQASAWTPLEKLSRLALKQKMTPTYRGKHISPISMLALALVEGGKEDIASQNYASAVKRLGEFVKSFGKHSRHHEGMFYLAEAYRGNSQHRDAIKTLLTFVDKYRRSQYYREALKRGGSWSNEMAYEDNTIFFYRRFVREFASDPSTPEIRMDLIDLFSGQQYYGDAIATLTAQAKDSRVDAMTKESAYHQILDMEARHGSEKRALDLATKLVRSSAVSDVVKADAYRLMARIAGRTGNEREVRRLAKGLESLSQASFEEQDALAEAKFILAKMSAKGVAEELFNLGLKDPHAALNRQYAKYKKARGRFDAVCQIGQTSFCAPSLHELARLSDEFLQSLEDISVQETLAKDVVDKFGSRKQAILNEVAATAQNADARSVQVVAEGTTDPNWTGVILWQNSSEWTGGRVSGDAGNGYVQFAAFEDESL